MIAKKGLSPLEIMKDEREYESLIASKDMLGRFDFTNALKQLCEEISRTRNHYVICYLANIINGQHCELDASDDLPFREMINQIPECNKEIDVVLATLGGEAAQVNRFVSVLRPRFDKVNFILLDKVMSAGTIFIMSGDEIIMSKQSCFGPIDPQIPNGRGSYIPAQSILVTIQGIQKRGEKMIEEGRNPLWTDIQILRNIDPRDIGFANMASGYVMDMVENFLLKYKFKNWGRNKTTGQPVTEEEKKKAAKEIAIRLCNHGKWKSHGYIINRDVARNDLGLEIRNSEDIEGLDRSLRCLWAFLQITFESNEIRKIFISRDYSLFRLTPQMMTKIRKDGKINR